MSCRQRQPAPQPLPQVGTAIFTTLTAPATQHGVRARVSPISMAIQPWSSA